MLLYFNYFYKGMDFYSIKNSCHSRYLRRNFKTKIRKSFCPKFLVMLLYLKCKCSISIHTWYKCTFVFQVLLVIYPLLARVYVYVLTISVDVESSFSGYKPISSDRRHYFTQQNLGIHFIVSLNKEFSDA